MKLWPAALLLLGVASLLVTWQLWSATVGSRTVISTPTPTATEVARVQPQPVPEQTGEPEAADLAHRQRVLERFACDACHGVDRGWPMPADHASMTEACQDCHEPAPEPTPIVVHVLMEQALPREPCGACHSDLAGYASLTTEAAGPTPTAALEQAECSSCHSRDTEELLPESHVERSQAISTCIVCHETLPLESPPVPHEVDRWAQCDFCHGEQRLTPLAGAHEGAVADQCFLCHSVIQLPPATHERMLLLSHEEGGCTSCHAEGSLAPLPASHLERGEELCTLCHQAAYEILPRAPHSLTERGPCRECHSAGVVGTLPDDHIYRAEESCAACHEEHPGGPPTIPHAIDSRTNCTSCHEPRP